VVGDRYPHNEQRLCPMQQRYDIRKEADETWTVIDVFTGLPVLIDGRSMVKLEMEEADDIVDLLNLADKRRRSESN